MRFISVRDFRRKSGQVWKRLAREKEMVITSNGKPIAILSPTSEESLEETLAGIRAARAITAVESIQLKSVRAGRDRMSLDEINVEIQTERRGRSK